MTKLREDKIHGRFATVQCRMIYKYLPIFYVKIED